VLGHGGKPMTEEAISERVERSRKSLLRDLAGTDDPEEVKKLIAKGKELGAFNKDQAEEYTRLKRQEEARKRARQTEQERVNADLATKDARIKQLEVQLKEQQQTELVHQQDSVISGAAQGYVAAQYMKHAKRDFAEAMVELFKKDAESFKKFGVKQTERWFEKWAKENPGLAKPAVDPSANGVDQASGAPVVPAAGTKPVVKRTVTTTKAPARPPAPAGADQAGSFKGKTVKPGQPNSMTKQELNEYMRSQGMRPY
jgi:hypothetical protein